MVARVVLVCFICTTLLLLPILTTPSWYVSNQSYRYPYLLEMFHEQFIAGQYYPRWLPRLEGGYGYPTFIFYPAGFWFMALPFILVTGDALLASKLALVAGLWLGGIGNYKLARCFCSPKIALLAAAISYLMPSIIYQLYTRGSLAELSAMMLCPWAFYHLAQIARPADKKKGPLANYIWLAIALAAVINTHPIIAVWLIFSLCLCGPCAAMESGQFIKVVCLLIATAVLALALSSPYWASAFALKEYVTAGDATSPRFLHRSSSIFTLMGPEYAGPVLPIMAFMGFYLGRKSWFVAGAMVASLALCIYMSDASLPLRNSIPALLYLQWPDRALSVFAALQTIGIASFLSWEEHAPPSDGNRRSIIIQAFIFILAIYFLAYISHPLRPQNFSLFRSEMAHTFSDMTHTGEFRPLTAKPEGLHPRLPGDPIAAASSGVTLIIDYNHADSDIGMNVESTEGKVTLTINQFYFPGWRVAVDGNPATQCPASAVTERLTSYCTGPNGLLRIDIPYAGKHTVRAWYDGVPGAALRNEMALTGGVISILALVLLSRRA